MKSAPTKSERSSLAQNFWRKRLIFEFQCHALDAAEPDEPKPLATGASEFDLGRIVFLSRLRPQHLDTLVTEHLDDRKWGHDNHVIKTTVAVPLGDLTSVVEWLGFLFHNRVSAKHIPEHFNLPPVWLVSRHPKNSLRFFHDGISCQEVKLHPKPY